MLGVVISFLIFLIVKYKNVFTLKVRLSKKGNIIYSGIPEFDSEYHLNACFEETEHYNNLTQKWSVFIVTVSYFDYYDDGEPMPHYHFHNYA